MTLLSRVGVKGGLRKDTHHSSADEGFDGRLGRERRTGEDALSIPVGRERSGGGEDDSHVRRRELISKLSKKRAVQVVSRVRLRQEKRSGRVAHQVRLSTASDGELDLLARVVLDLGCR